MERIHFHGEGRKLYDTDRNHIGLCLPYFRVGDTINTILGLHTSLINGRKPIALHAQQASGRSAEPRRACVKGLMKS